MQNEGMHITQWNLVKCLFRHKHLLSFCSLFLTFPSFIPAPLSCIIFCIFSLLFLHCHPDFSSVTARKRMMLGWMWRGRWGGITMQEAEKLPVQPSSPPLCQASRCAQTHTDTHRHTHIHTYLDCVISPCEGPSCSACSQSICSISPLTHIEFPSPTTL